MANIIKLSVIDGHEIQKDGISQNQREKLNFVGEGAEITDDSVNNATNINIARGGHTIQENGISLTQRGNLNFTGTGVTASDDSQNNTTNINISGNGINAFTEVALDYTQPPVSNNVIIDVVNSEWMAVGGILFISNGGYYEVVSIPSATQVEVTNLGYSQNASSGTMLTAGERVSPSGIRGVEGNPGSVTATSSLELVNQMSNPTQQPGRTLIYADSNGDIFKVLEDGNISEIGSNTGSGISGLRVLTSNTTFYVDRVNGNDNNDGLSAANAWQTFNKANQEVSRTFLAGFNLTIQLTDNDDFSLEAPAFDLLYPFGSGSYTIQGNSNDRTLVKLPRLNITNQRFSGVALIQDLTVEDTFSTNPRALSIDNSVLKIINLLIRGTGFSVQLFNNSFLTSEDNDTIFFEYTGGDIFAAFFAARNCTLDFFAITFNVTGNPTFGNGFLFADENSYIGHRNGSFVGAFSGSQYFTDGNSTIRQANGSDVNS